MNPSLWTSERFRLALSLMEKACVLAASIQKERKEAFTKSDLSPVTAADLATQALFSLGLREPFPSDVLLAEETASPLVEDRSLRAFVLSALQSHFSTLGEKRLLEAFESSSELGDAYWILDPIDGTKGFLRGDQFAIALAYREGGRTQFGLLGCPNLAIRGTEPGAGVIAVAFAGQGAWQKSLVSGGSEWGKLEVSQVTEPSKLRLLRSFEASHTNEPQIDSLVKRLNIEAEPLRLDSQAKYVLLARGEAEAILRCPPERQPNYKEKVWDQAAGSILALEAGGLVTDLEGTELDFGHGERLEKNVGVVASNGRLHRALIDDMGIVPVR